MRLALALVCAVSLTAAAPVSGQDRTDEELLLILQKQAELRKAEAAGEEVATRGLKIVSADEVMVSDASPAMGSAGTDDAAATALAATDGGVSVTSAPGGLDAPTGDAIDLATASETADAPAAAAVVAVAAVEPVKVAQFSDDLTIDVNIRFGYDSAALADDQIPRLAQMCRVMRKSGVSLFEISGHTDAAGSDSYNSRLSLQRAEEVARYVVNTCGIEAARIRTVGKGETLLKNPADPRGGENRRVEFQALG